MEILLDTSFLLPTLGIATDAPVARALAEAADRRHKLHYSRLSLLEASWVFSRVAERGSDSGSNRVAFDRGIRSVVHSGRYSEVVEPPEAYSGALKLRSLGHRDLVDCLLYLDSVHYGLRLLTLDSELRHFLARHNLGDTLVFPDGLD
jgi:hypothetical protein